MSTLVGVSDVSRKTQNRDAGFTLVEILCVLALLGLTAGLVVLNLPKQGPAVETEIQAFATTMNLAARQSVIDGRVRGIDVQTGRAEIFKYDGEWTSEYSRDFTRIYDLRLQVEGQDIDLKARAKSKKDLPPLILLDATGNVTPFILSLNGRDKNYTMSPNQRGRIIMQAEP